MLLYYISDRSQFPGDEQERQRALLQKIAEASRAGVDLIQLREKDLCTSDLQELARAAGRTIHEYSQRTRLLINSRSDVALACVADGVHLRGTDISAQDVRTIWQRAGRTASPLVIASCHTIGEVARAASEGGDFAVIGPVFEKQGSPRTNGAGLEALRQACEQGMPVLALGGVDLGNVRACIEAGAAGIAGIRLFQQNDVAEIVRALRS